MRLAERHIDHVCKLDAVVAAVSLSTYAQDAVSSRSCQECFDVCRGDVNGAMRCANLTSVSCKDDYIAAIICTRSSIKNMTSAISKCVGQACANSTEMLANHQSFILNWAANATSSEALTLSAEHCSCLQAVSGCFKRESSLCVTSLTRSDPSCEAICPQSDIKSFCDVGNWSSRTHVSAIVVVAMTIVAMFTV